MTSSTRTTHLHSTFGGLPRVRCLTKDCKQEAEGRGRRKGRSGRLGTVQGDEGGVCDPRKQKKTSCVPAGQCGQDVHEISSDLLVFWRRKSSLGSVTQFSKFSAQAVFCVTFGAYRPVPLHKKGLRTTFFWLPPRMEKHNLHSQFFSPERFETCAVRQFVLRVQAIERFWLFDRSVSKVQQM